MSNNYVAYHVHSDLSLLDSVTDFRDYVDYAVELGQKAIAFSEHGKPLNWVSKKIYCDQKGIKYLHAVEIYVTEQLEPKVRDNMHCVLIAKNYDGVLELNKAVSKSCDEAHFYYKNRLSIDEICNLSKNIIITSACLASPLNRLDVNNPRYKELVKRMDYLEIQPHDCDDQRVFNIHLAQLASEYNKPLIAGTDAHALNAYKAECRKIILTRKHLSYGDEDSFDLTYKSYDELVEAFRKQDALPEALWMQAIENTNIMADSVEEFELDTSFKYPILYGSAEEDARKFEEVVWEKFKQKLVSGIIPLEQKEGFEKALKEELEVFKKIQMSGFMLSMSELISWCHDNGIVTGFARGSVAGSRAAYVSDIIDVNPEQWNTVFSRFANEDRVETGDIDTDVIEEDRPKIFEYVIKKFGERNTARVASYGTNKELGTIDDICGALRIRWNLDHELKENDRTTDNPYCLEKADKIKREYTADADATKDKYPELFYYFDGIVGTKVSQSVHPAGMVISPISLDDNFGTFEKDGMSCLMLDMEDAHAVGLVKYDFLVLSNIKIIKDTCDSAGIPYPKSHEINWDDKVVWQDMLRSPYGIFQMESNYSYTLLRQYKPTSIEEMSLVSACVRPSGASYRDDLIARIPHKNPSPIIDELLKANNGYLCVEENQLVDIPNGRKPIKELKIGDMVKTRNGYSRVSNVVNTGVKDCIELEFLGSSIKCSKNHKILSDIGWIDAGLIGEGDCVAVRVGDVHSHGTLDCNYAKILGWLIGDGYVTGSSSPGFYNIDSDVINDFAKTLTLQYPEMSCTISSRTNPRTGVVLYKCGTKRTIHKPFTTPLKEDLVRDGLWGKNALSKFIPQRVFDMTKEEKLSFLGAYTDTDCAINNGAHKVVSYTTSSEKLASDLQFLIRTLGFAANITKETDKAFHIGVKNYEDYVEMLYDYSIVLRKKMPNKPVAARKTHSLIRREVVVSVIDKIGVSKKKLMRTTGVNLYQKQKYISVNSVIKLAQECPEIKSELPFVFDPNIVWTKIRRVNDFGRRNMFDISVETEHEFVCQGIVVHNCYQEDQIQFLQQICGLSGSEADTVRRAIGKKNKEVIDKALPVILEGYCNKSDKPREEAEQEAREFLQVLEDAASYSFGYNHSVAYCLIGYLCAYLRYYHPFEFITSYLNNAASQEDIEHGVELAKEYGIVVTAPKFGVSRENYVFDKERRIIARGLSSVKFFNKKIGRELNWVAEHCNCKDFTDVLLALKGTSIDSRHIDILVKIDFFSDFGNIAELTRIVNTFRQLKEGEIKKLKREGLSETIEDIVAKHGTCVNAKGQELKTYSITDPIGLLHDLEAQIRSLHLKDIGLAVKIANQIDILGYASLTTNNPEDRRKLYIEDMTPVITNGRLWSYRLDVMSVGTGRRSRLTLKTGYFTSHPIAKGQLIYCDDLYKNKRGFWEITRYHRIY